MPDETEPTTVAPEDSGPGRPDVESTEVVAYGRSKYSVVRRPLSRGGRTDVEVPDAPPAIDSVDRVTPALRQFFDDLDRELDVRKLDPIALVHAVARLEAIGSDLRYVRDNAKRYLADALRRYGIRMITVSSVATMEGNASIDRSGWRHAELLTALLNESHWVVLDGDTGERLDSGIVATRLLGWLTPSWKLNGVRGEGLDPNDFCDVARDDDNKPVSTPGVRIIDNAVRRLR